jgi:hypothetical protein
MARQEYSKKISLLYIGAKLKWANAPRFLFKHRFSPTNTSFIDKDAPLTKQDRPPNLVIVKMVQYKLRFASMGQKANLNFGEF